MKKIMCLTLILLLCLGVALVSGQQQSFGQQQKPSIGAQKIIAMNQEMAQSHVREMIQTKVMGLENAMLHVENENARQRLTENMEQWQNRYTYRYDQAEGTIVDGTAMIKTRNKHMFLGLFEVQSEHIYELDDEGVIQSRKRNFWAYLFRERVQQIN